MQDQKTFDTWIVGTDQGLRLDLKDLLKCKSLIYLLTRKEFVSKYKQSILGPLWMFINPIVGSVVFALVFGTFAGLGTDGLPRILFYLSGNTFWSLFSTIVVASSNAFFTNRNLVSKVYFPRLAVFISTAVSGCIIFAIQFVMLCGFIVYYNVTGTATPFTPYLFLVPVLVLQNVLLGLGVGMTLSSLTIKYRDFVQMISFGISLWMYLTPVAYPLSVSSGKLYTLMLFNPMTSIIQNYRFSLLGSGSFLLLPWIISLVITVVMLLVGLWSFRRVERTVIDIL